MQKSSKQQTSKPSSKPSIFQQFKTQKLFNQMQVNNATLFPIHTLCQYKDKLSDSFVNHSQMVVQAQQGETYKTINQFNQQPLDVLLNYHDYDFILQLYTSNKFDFLVPYLLQESGYSVVFAVIKYYSQQTQLEKQEEVVHFFGNFLKCHYQFCESYGLLQFSKQQLQQLSLVQQSKYQFNRRDTYNQTSLQMLFSEPDLLLMVYQQCKLRNILPMFESFVRSEAMISDNTNDFALHKYFEALQLQYERQFQISTEASQSLLFPLQSNQIPELNSLIPQMPQHVELLQYLLGIQQLLPELSTKNKLRRTPLFYAPTFLIPQFFKQIGVSFPKSNQDIYQRTPLLHISRLGSARFQLQKEWFEAPELENELEVVDKQNGFIAYYLLIDQINDSENMQFLAKLKGQLSQVFALNGCSGLHLCSIFENASVFQQQIKLKLDQTKQTQPSFCGLPLRDCNHFQGYISQEGDETALAFQNIFQLKIEQLYKIHQRFVQSGREPQFTIKSNQGITIASQFIQMLCDAHNRGVIQIIPTVQNNGQRMEINIISQFPVQFNQFLIKTFNQVNDKIPQLTFNPYYYFIKSNVFQTKLSLEAKLLICKTPQRYAGQIFWQFCSETVANKARNVKKQTDQQLIWKAIKGFGQDQAIIDLLGLIIEGDQSGSIVVLNDYLSWFTQTKSGHLSFLYNAYNSYYLQFSLTLSLSSINYLKLSYSYSRRPYLFSKSLIRTF